MQPNEEAQTDGQDTSTPETIVQPTVTEQPAAAPTVTAPIAAEQPQAPAAGTAIGGPAVTPATPEQPMAASFSTTVPPQAPPQPSGKRKKLSLIAGIAGLVLLLGGGGAAAYYGMVLPNQPQRIAQQAIANTIDQEKVQSGYFEGEVTFEGGDISKSVSGVTFKGASSKTGAMDLSLSVNSVLTKIGLDVKTEDSKTLYVKLSGLNGLDKLLAAYGGDSAGSEVSAYASLIASVNDKWFTIDQSLLSQIGGEAATAVDSGLSSEDTKRVGEIYKSHQFLNIDKKLADEDIHGTASHHIQASINKDQMIAFLNEVKSANIKSLPIEQSMIDEVSKVDFSKYPFEMWVGKKDRFVTQLATTIEESGTKFKVRVALFDINKPVTVEKPADAKSLLELLSEVSQLNGGVLGANTGLGANLPSFIL